MANVYHEVKSVADLAKEPEDYQTSVKKIVVSHALNELYGAQVFDEPAIALAPTPYAKWLTCRVAMEEYHHHVRFKGLAEEMGVPADAYDPSNKKPLSIFGFKLKTWPEFCVIKMLADLAEILQVEDLLHCTFVPLRNIGRITMPEEKFHAQFGRDFCTELCKTEAGKREGEQQHADERGLKGIEGFGVQPSIDGHGGRGHHVGRGHALPMPAGVSMEIGTPL